MKSKWEIKFDTPVLVMGRFWRCFSPNLGRQKSGDFQRVQFYWEDFLQGKA